MLDRILVRWESAKRPIRRKTEQHAVRHCAPNRVVAGAFGVEPRRHARERTRLIIVQRRGAHDGIVENRQDGGAVLRHRTRDELHRPDATTSRPEVDCGRATPVPCIYSWTLAVWRLLRSFG